MVPYFLILQLIPSILFLTHMVGTKKNEVEHVFSNQRQGMVYIL